MTADYKQFADDVAEYLKIDTTKRRISIDTVKETVQESIAKGFEVGFDLGQEGLED